MFLWFLFSKTFATLIRRPCCLTFVAFCNEYEILNIWRVRTSNEQLVACFVLIDRCKSAQVSEPPISEPRLIIKLRALSVVRNPSLRPPPVKDSAQETLDHPSRCCILAASLPRFVLQL